MKKNFGAKTWLYPMPVLILAAYDEAGVPNAMNAAWGGISEMNEISLCVSPGHKTVKNALAKGAFTVSIADGANVVACDYVGIVSGNNVPDKFERAGFHATKSQFVDAPVIDELPMTLECRLVQYDAETCRLVGEIVNVAVEEAVLREDDTIDTQKMNPIMYDTVNKAYWGVGEKVGNAYEDGKKLK